MLLIILTHIALYQIAVQVFLTILVYSIGLSFPFIIISSLGGAVGKAVKEKARISGEVFDKIFGEQIVLIGIYFIWLEFR